MDLNEIAVFVKVVQLGSFSGAGRVLGMPNSTVSTKVSTLEKRLGLTLIQRTTRKLSVTPAGRAYFERCVRALGELEAAEGEAVAGQAEPNGVLRLTAPVELGNTVLPDLLVGFLKAHPRVNVEVTLSDRRVDLLAEGIDLALRAGQLKDSSLIAKRIGQVSFGLFASPRYLKEHGAPKKPVDLRKLKTIHFNPVGSGLWTLHGPGGVVEIEVAARLRLNDLNLVKTMALRDGGVALLPSFFCGPEMRSGKLIRVLPDWATQTNPVQFVYPAQKFVPTRLSAFISFSTEKLRLILTDGLA